MSFLNKILDKFSKKKIGKFRHIKELEKDMTKEQKENAEKIYNEIIGKYIGTECVLCQSSESDEDCEKYLNPVNLEDFKD